jgi:beta-N-acetylhexosaminidase
VAVDPSDRRPRAVVFGVAGPTLEERERALFAATDPLGFILFGRNCRDPAQVRRLVEALRAAVGRDDAPVLIDQEGGRVARLRPPHWRAAPAAATFGRLAPADEGLAVEAAWLNARLMAAELAALGISIDCAPVLDVPQPDADPVIGDRAAGDTPAHAALLGRAMCAGLLDGGVLPVIKHVPGHGRATVDSHAGLPVVDASRSELERSDFAPFHALRDMPWAMTAHVVYRAIDGAAPATTSAMVIETVIRGSIGFDGVLISDDVCMAALSGPTEERALAALAAGCDVVLHCNGVFEEVAAVAERCPALTDAAAERIRRGEAMRRTPGTFDVASATARLSRLMERAAA